MVWRVGAATTEIRLQGELDGSTTAAVRAAFWEVVGAGDTDLVVDPADTNLADAHRGALGAAAGTGIPVVFECVGVEGTLSQAMQLVDRGGRVIVVGVCMTEDRIHPMVGINKQLTLKFVRGYTTEEYEEALTDLGDRKIDTSPMVTRTISIDELPAAFEALAEPNDCKIVVVP